MIKHYEGELGNFDYDDEEFEVVCEYGLITYLHYVGKGLFVNLPHGCVSTACMFSDCNLPEGFSLGDDFDTSNVVNMSNMFMNCNLPEGFSLENKFDTSKVIKMDGMFMNCNLPEGFSLGNRFDTSNVMDMSSMFMNCNLPEGFSLGDIFNTSEVVYMNTMFSYCKLFKGFTLGDKFDTSNVLAMNGMFMCCFLPEGFTLGDKFNTSNVKNMIDMFSGCVISGLSNIKDPQEIINRLKQPSVSSKIAQNSSNESVVWGILDKSKYTGNDITDLEQTYIHLNHIKDMFGLEYLKVLLNMWIYHEEETIKILKSLINAEGTESMNLF